MTRPLTLADGQLGTTAAQILAGSSAPANRITVVLQNVSSNEQTVTLTFSRAGGTARRLARAVLDQNEQLYLTGLPMQPDDSLLGMAGASAAVDYLIFTAGEGPLSVRTLAADGAERGISTNESPNRLINGQVATAVFDDEARRLAETTLLEVRALRQLHETEGV